MNKISKTNAMRILDQAHIDYQTYTYPHRNQAVDGVEVATLLQQNPDQVFKTLVCIGQSKQFYVCMIPVACTLHLKAVAKAVHEKHIEMIPVKEITKITGYVRGGCSPLGMKKQFSTILHSSANNLDTIIFSGGKIGLQIACNPKALADITHAQFIPIVDKKED